MSEFRDHEIQAGTMVGFGLGKNNKFIAGGSEFMKSNNSVAEIVVEKNDKTQKFSSQTQTQFKSQVQTKLKEKPQAEQAEVKKSVPKKLPTRPKWVKLPRNFAKK